MLNVIRHLALATALLWPAMAWSQTVEATDERPVVAMDSQEYRDLPRDRQIAIFNRELETRIDALSALAPNLVETGEYRFDGDSRALEDLLYNLSVFRTNVQVGGAYRNILQVHLANAEDLIQRVEDSPTMKEQDREEFLIELNAQATDLRGLREDMDRVQDVIREFIQIEAPAIEEEYRLREEIGRNREVIREFRLLQTTMESIMSVVSDRDDPPPQGVD